MQRLSILAALSLVVSSLITLGWGQTAVDSSGAFDIRVKEKVIGHEDYKMAATKQGFILSSSIHIEVRGASTTMQQEQTLGSDWSLLHYTLKFDPQQATVEAWKDGDKAQMRVQTGGQMPAKTADWIPRTLVVDNNVTSHFQVLLNQFSLVPGAKSQEFQLLVPQLLLPIKVTLAVVGPDKGALAGKNIALTHYEMTFGASTTQIWADDQGRLMRVAQKGSDAVRSGFEMTESQSAAAAGSSNGGEKQITFPSGNMQIPGNLMLPAQKKDKVPLIVMVGGSGPHDRDETIGPNKPFLDLAQGLAAKGIATLRYDKRTFAFKGAYDASHFTVQDEVIDDAVAALRYARSLPEVDAGSVFLLGHSQGAELAPFIVQLEPSARGAILMAAPGRPLDELLLEQIAFQGRAQGQQQMASAQISKLSAKFAAIRTGTLPDSEIVLGAPAIYYRDLFKRDQMAALHNTKIPVLVLQGGRDVQIVSKDYDLVTSAVPPAMLEKHFFPDLNHLFMSAKEGATGEEIMSTPGHVASEVIDAIAVWVGKQKGASATK